MKLRFRQGLVSYQVSTSGVAAFIQKNGSDDQFIDLICDEQPVVFTIAHGDSNYLIQENKSVSKAWGPLVSHGQTQYLYWDISLLNASITRGFTLVPPYFGINAPTQPINDQHWFDTIFNVMKVWNGSKWVPKIRLFAGNYNNNAIINPEPKHISQVNLNSPCEAGNILIGKNGIPLRDSDGTFATTESNIISAYTSGENLKFEAVQMFGEALEFIPKFSMITYAQPGKFKLASSARPTEIINGLVSTECFPGEIVNIISNGLVRNDQWAFLANDINKPLYIGTSGEVTLEEPLLPKKVQIGYVYDQSAIFINIQQITTTLIVDTGAQPVDLTIDLVGDITASGVTGTPITTVLSDTGVIAGTYNSVTVDGQGRIIDATVELLDGPITLTGPITGTGTGTIVTAIEPTGVIAGTYNSVTVDVDGRISNGTIENYEQTISLSGDATGSGVAGINVTLSDTGVTPGTYNSITVDSKGRITSASVVSSGLQYLHELLDVSIMDPAVLQPLVFNGSNWVNGYSNQIKFNTAVVSTINDGVIDLIKHTINAKDVIVSTEASSTIGVLTDTYWIAALGHINNVKLENKGLCLDSLGNILVYGNLEENGSRTGYIAKYAQDGVIIWQKKIINSSYSVYQRGAIADSNNDFYVTVDISDNGNLVKIDGTTGAEIWTVPLYQWFVPSDICISPADVISIVGRDTDTGNSIIISVNSSNGSITNNIEIQTSSILAILTPDSTGDYYVCGWLNTPSGNSGTAFMQMQNDGTILKSLFIDFSIGARFVDLDINGNSVFLVATEPNNIGSPFQANIVEYDLTTETMIQCKRITSTTLNIEFFGIDVDSSGSVYVSGHLNSSDYYNPLPLSLYLTKLDSLLNPIWERKINNINVPEVQGTNNSFDGYNYIKLFNDAILFSGTAGGIYDYTRFAIVGKYPTSGNLLAAVDPFSVSSVSLTYNDTIIDFIAPLDNVITPNISKSLTSNISSIDVSDKLSELAFFGGINPYEVNLNAQLNINSTPGNFGQVLTSRGSGATPSWSNPSAPSAGTLISITPFNNTSKISVLDSFYNPGNTTLIIGSSNSTAVSNSTFSRCTGFGQNVFNDYFLTNNYGYVNGLVAIGTNAMSGVIDGAYYNVGIGYDAALNCTGQDNVGIGQGAMYNASGYNNIALGRSVLSGNTGNNNIGLGTSNLRYNSGTSNISIGNNSQQENTSGSENISIGASSLTFNTIGSYNIAIGSLTSRYSAIRNYNTAVGYSALSGNDLYSNVTGIGNGAQITGANQVQLGNSLTTTYVYGTVQNRSDERDKAEIRDTLLGLDFISSLRPVDYKWNYREDYKILNADGTITELPNDGSKTRNRYHHGLIAQEVKQVIDSKALDFGGYQDHLIDGGQDIQSLGYDELIAPLIKSIQELKSIVESQQALINSLMPPV